MIRIRRLVFIFFTLLFSVHVSAILPLENSRLHYTTVYFEEDLKLHARSYEFILSIDSLMNKSLPSVLTTMSSLPAFRCPDLNWGERYYWKVNAYDQDHKLIHEGQLHTFKIVKIFYYFPDVLMARFDIRTNKSDKHAQGLILLDYTRSIYTRSGKAVWTLPNIPNVVGPESQVRDLKMTLDNTLTFVTERNAVEIGLDAKVIWKAPSPFVFGKDSVLYHHDLTKTKRGTYMVLATRKVLRPFLQNYTEAQLQNEAEIVVMDKKVFKKTQMTVLLEFDHDGKLIWFWDANTYVKDEDLLYKKLESGAPLFTTHVNSFSESADGSIVYVGFRDLSRIVKIEKNTKKVIKSYGEKFPSGDAIAANNLFRKQHDGTITNRNSLLIFNNNEATLPNEKRKVSSIIEIKENATLKDNDLLWSFALDFDTLTNAWSNGGGNVTELPNSNLLLCAGTLNRVFEVTRDKEIVWDALILSHSKDNSGWKPFPQYRCSWLPSLNEYHFIPEILENSTAKDLQLSITNTGNTDDRYRVQVFESGKNIFEMLTPLISSATKTEHIVNLKALSEKAHTLAIRIQSESGKFTKEISFDVNHAK